MYYCSWIIRFFSVILPPCFIKIIVCLGFRNLGRECVCLFFFGKFGEMNSESLEVFSLKKVVKMGRENNALSRML
jgi:hypothetical protein